MTLPVSPPLVPVMPCVYDAVTEVSRLWRAYENPIATIYNEVLEAIVRVKDRYLGTACNGLLRLVLAIFPFLVEYLLLKGVEYAEIPNGMTGQRNAIEEVPEREIPF